MKMERDMRIFRVGSHVARRLLRTGAAVAEGAFIHPGHSSGIVEVAGRTRGEAARALARVADAIGISVEEAGLVEAVEDPSDLTDAVTEADRALAEVEAMVDVVNLGPGIVGEGRRDALRRALVAASAGLREACAVLADVAE